MNFTEHKKLYNVHWIPDILLNETVTFQEAFKTFMGGDEGYEKEITMFCSCEKYEVRLL